MLNFQLVFGEGGGKLTQGVYHYENMSGNMSKMYMKSVVLKDRTSTKYNISHNK